MSYPDLNDVEETDALMSAASPSASSVSDGQPQAPAFKIPSRTIAAVEHPFLIQNLDKGLDTFGPNPQFQSVRSHHCFLPLHLDTKNLTCVLGLGSLQAATLCASVSSTPRSFFKTNDVPLRVIS